MNFKAPALIFITLLPLLCWGLESPKLVPCEKKIRPEVSYFISQAFCDSTGTLRIYKRLFQSNPKQAVEIFTFNNQEQLTDYKSFSAEGTETIATTYEPQADGSYLTYHHGKKHERHLIEIFPEFKTEKIEAWFYKENKLSFQEDYHNTNFESWPRKLTLFDKNENPQESYELEYRKNKRGITVISKFDLFNSTGEKIGTYNENQKLMAPKENPARTPVVIIDTGFDVSHPDLKNYFSSRFTGEYNDPAFERERSAYIHDSIVPSANRTPPFPFSHGTHVASIAMKGTKNFEAVGFAGDYSDPEYLDRISKFIYQHRIPFVNMSFGFGEKENPFGANGEARMALYRLMDQNPETLFIIAAGNSTSKVTSDTDSDWPAGIPLNNKLVVAATNDSEYSQSSLNRATLTSFSSFGPHVDFGAPGLDVDGANIGGLRVRVSGTSMASPFVMNVAMKVQEKFPYLTPLQVRDKLLNSVTIPPIPLPLKTQGALDVSKALK